MLENSNYSINWNLFKKRAETKKGQTPIGPLLRGTNWGLSLFGSPDFKFNRTNYNFFFAAATNPTNNGPGLSGLDLNSG